MAIKARRIERRAQPLSKEQIISAAIEILDAAGEEALTFRALASRLMTGSGAIYWHVADRNELLAAAADHVVARAMDGMDAGMTPRERIRATALGVFDAVDAHPWMGRQLSREPWRPGTLRAFESIGGGIVALGVAEATQFHAWSALVNYLLGVAAQNAANARCFGRLDRSAFLETVAERWERLDAAEHPFVRRLGRQLREHDDREQFLAGIDLIIDGMRTC